MAKKIGNRTIFLIVVFITVLPLVLAWFALQNPELFGKRDNYGHLVVPPIPLNYEGLTPVDAHAQEAMSEIKGRWMILQIQSVPQCTQFCQSSLQITQKLWLRLNKDLSRVRRVLMINFPATEQSENTAFDPYVLRVSANARWLEQISKAIDGKLEEGMIFLVDPLGNFFMWYEAGFDPYGMTKDFNRLLSVSRIG